MKFKTTRQYVCNQMPIVIGFGYCELANILRHFEPIAYTVGLYGWNADIYTPSPTVAIVTGFRPFERFSTKNAPKAEKIRSELLALNARADKLSVTEIETEIERILSDEK